MIKYNIVFLFLTILSISPFLLNISTVLDPYGYSVLILTNTINTNGFIDFQNFTLGDHWRGHAKNILGDIRPLTSIFIAMLSQITLLDPLGLASIPLFLLLIPVIVFLFIRKTLISDHKSSSDYIFFLFYVAAISLLQPGGIHFLSHGFFLMILLLYVGVRWIKYGSPTDAILTLIVFIAASRTHYTTYTASAMFLLGMLLYMVLFLRERRRYWSFTLVSVVFLFIVLWYDNILQATLRTISFENIHAAVNRIMMFRLDTPQVANPYIEMVLINPGTAIANSVMRVGLGIMGAYALFACLKNKEFRKDLPIVMGLLFMGLFETFTYTLIGGVFLVRLLYSISLPFLIILWARSFMKNSNKHKKASAILLIILCMLSITIVLRNYETISDRQMIVKNVEMIDSVTYNVNMFFKNNVSYTMVAGSTESALLSYKTFKPEYRALATFGPFSRIMDGDLDGFMAEIDGLPQDIKIIFLPRNYPYIEIHAWGDIYLLKSEFYVKLANKLNVIYDGPFKIYENTQC